MRVPLKYAIQPSGTKKLKFFPAVFWCGLIVTLFQVAFYGFNIYIITTNSFIVTKKESNTTLFTATVISVCVIWIKLIMFNSYGRRYSQFLDIFCNRLNRFDQKLQLEKTTFGLSVKTTALIAISVVAPILIQVVHIDKILSLAENQTVLIMNGLNTVSFIIIQCEQTSMLIHFQPITHCISERFRRIHTNIIQEVNNDIYIQSMQQRNPPHLRHNQDRNANDRINPFMIAYHLLCDAVCQANEFYSDLLLASIFYGFLRVTSALYFLFIRLVIKDATGVIIAIVRTLSTTCYLCVIVSSSSDVTLAAQDTTTVISKLIRYPNINPGLKKQLNSFLFQLTKQHLEFFAGGFFNVNRKMLTSMGATVATYLPSASKFERPPLLGVWMSIQFLLRKRTQELPGARRGSDVRINALAALSNTTKLPAVQQKPVQYRSLNTKIRTNSELTVQNSKNKYIARLRAYGVQSKVDPRAHMRLRRFKG
ncbi:hypothetical protein J6590_089290 [Homalodisca vitripennis]|nr:hypothetical protein J6590_089290 [Homalodisca vitripennis]